MTTPERPMHKLSDVQMIEGMMYPAATCLGIRVESGDPQGFDQLVDCGWRFPQIHRSLPPMAGETKKQARNHALLHPGHTIEVEQKTRTVYWIDLSDAELDALIEAKRAADDVKVRDSDGG